jgi:CRP/FNR family transcriptional regulator, cyclic AMP receptor protein
MTPAKITLRATLCRNGERLGLTTSAIEQLVERAQVTHWERGRTIFARGDVPDLSYFVIAGVVRVACQETSGRTVTVEFVRPGQFFGLVWPFDDTQQRRLTAVAHVSSSVAMVGREALATILAELPPGRALRLMAQTWRTLSRVVIEKCLLLAMPLRERLLYELSMLARQFGQTVDHHVLIDVPLTHADLAMLVAATRPNVTRCLAELRRAGRIEVVGNRLALSVSSDVS